jgi:hypothetical protein
MLWGGQQTERKICLAHVLHAIHTLKKEDSPSKKAKATGKGKDKEEATPPAGSPVAA